MPTLQDLRRPRLIALPGLVGLLLLLALPQASQAQRGDGRYQADGKKQNREQPRRQQRRAPSKPFSGPFLENVQGYAGFFLEFIPVREKFTGQNIFETELPPFFYTVTAGGHYIAMQSGDMYSLSLNPQLNFSFRLDSRTGATILAQMPFMAMARIGANSTPYNESKFGGGAGIGLNYTFVKFPVIDNSNGSIESFQQSYAAPAFALEATLQLPGGLYSVRFHKNLLWSSGELDFGGQTLPLDLNSFGLGVAYYFY
jgi:hypothetical protein